MLHPPIVQLQAGIFIPKRRCLRLGGHMILPDESTLGVPFHTDALTLPLALYHEEVITFASPYVTLGTETFSDPKTWASTDIVGRGRGREVRGQKTQGKR
jgi:hypothetical protein